MDLFLILTVFSGEGKQKNVPVEGRTRRVLQDIGNLVAERAVEGKLHAQISQPIARSTSLFPSLPLHPNTPKGTPPWSLAHKINFCLAGHWVMHKQQLRRTRWSQKLISSNHSLSSSLEFLQSHQLNFLNSAEANSSSSSCRYCSW